MKSNLKIALLLITMALVMACNNKNQKEMDINKKRTTRNFSERKSFTARMVHWETDLHPMVAKDKNNDFSAGAVTFEPGARTKWHTHPKDKCQW